MKIAIVNPWSISDKSIGGTERFVNDLAKSFSELGHAVDVYMFSGSSYKKDGINYISLNLFGEKVIADEYMISREFGDFDTRGSYIKLAAKLEKLINGHDYDLMHLNSPYFLLAWRDCRRIFTHHSNYEELRIVFSEQEYKEMIEIVKEQSSNNLTKFVCPSKYYKKKWDILCGNNTVYIPHAIDPKRLKINFKKEEIYKKYCLSSELVTVLLPSRLEPIQKRPKLFLEACSLLNSNEKKKIQIILTGIDDQYEQYIEELSQFSITNNINVHFIKFNSINEGYLISDIVVVPSKSESFGYSALEGLTLGIITILSDIPTFHEIASGNNQAIFFNGTSNDLFAKMNKLLYNNAIQRKLPSDVWLNQFDIKLFGRRYLEVFDDE